MVAALAVNHSIEKRTGWSIKKFLRTARRYRTVKIKALLLEERPLVQGVRSALMKASTSWWLSYPFSCIRI